MRKVRRLRHWKQQFNPNAKFIWNKPILWAGEYVKVGSPVPAKLLNIPIKLQRFWSAGVIELAEFEAPLDILNPAAKAEADNPSEAVIIKLGNGWVSNYFPDKVFRTLKEAEAETELRIEDMAPKLAEGPHEVETGQETEIEVTPDNPNATDIEASDNDDWLNGDTDETLSSEDPLQ